MSETEQAPKPTSTKEADWQLYKQLSKAHHKMTMQIRQSRKIRKGYLDTMLQLRRMWKFPKIDPQYKSR